MNPNAHGQDIPYEAERMKASQGKLLALETSGKAASVALAWPDGNIAEAETDPTIGSARTLAHAIQRLLDVHRVTATDLAAIAVTVGPGSFTGLRVGVATAKAMAYALKIPTIAIDSLETIAVDATYRLSLDNRPSSTWIWTIMDAFRGQLFAALWLATPDKTTLDADNHNRDLEQRILEGRAIESILSSHLVDSATWMQAILAGNSIPPKLVAPGATLGEYPIVIAGPGLNRCTPLFASDNAPSNFRILQGVLPRAAVVADLGQRKLAKRETIDPFRLMPVYLRGSAAEEKMSTS